MPLPSVHDNSIARLASAPPPGFKCALSSGSFQSAWVRAAGELESAAAHALERTLHQAVTRARLLVLDLRDLTLIERAAAQVIVDASVRAARASCRMVLIQGSPQVRRMFALTDVNRLIETVEHPAEINSDLTLSVVTLL